MARSMYRAMREYLRSTTLHGFKYLLSPHYTDRVGWVMNCCMGACTAAVLCAVLWTRFQHSPLILMQGSLSSPSKVENSVPMVAICPSPYRSARLLAEHLSMDLEELDWLPILFNNILRGRPAPDAVLLRLDELLDTHNLTLYKALMDLMSPCKELMKKCQWHSRLVQCNQLFEMEMTRWGACCVMRPERLSKVEILVKRILTTERLDMNMDCYFEQNGGSYCCEFFIKYRGEEWNGPWYLMSGYSYTAHLQFTSIQDTDKDKLVDGACVSTLDYSYSRCMVICKETECGCTHPLRLREYLETISRPLCTVMQLKCLGNFIRDNDSCNCLQACQKIAVTMSMETAEIKENVISYNPIYANVHSNSSIVLNLRVEVNNSKTYDLKSTVTWFTLLASLGGVFNMFLGFGLFSVLECVFLLTRLKYYF